MSKYKIYNANQLLVSVPHTCNTTDHHVEWHVVTRRPNMSDDAVASMYESIAMHNPCSVCARAVAEHNAKGHTRITFKRF